MPARSLLERHTGCHQQANGEVPDRWVTCGYEYKQADPAVVAEFQDRVDSKVLDYFYVSGRL